jgi:hypothetical protein
VIGSYVGAMLILLGFSWLLYRLQLVERSGRVSGIVRQSAATAADRSLGDAAKGQALRRNSLALFGLFADLTFRLLLAVGLPMLVVWLLAFARLWSFEGALEATVSWPFLIAGLLLFFIIFLRSGRRRED